MTVFRDSTLRVNDGDDPLLAWGNSGTLVGNTTSTLAIEKANIALVVTTLRAGTYAAKACDHYSVVTDETTYDDWFLPSRDKLRGLYLELINIGEFTSYHYWSSS